jgi:hypothetical protein
VFPEVVPFHEEHDSGVELFMPVDYTKEIAGISLCENLGEVSAERDKK